MNSKFFRTFPAMAVALLLAACSQDELVDGNGTSLPEGKYPLQIGSVSITADVDGQPWSAGAPQTRVSENDDHNSSHWDNGDKIKVQIADGTPGTYTYQDGSLTVADGDLPAYWASKDDAQSIRAWHTSSGSETVELNNQTGKLAYVLTAQATANFNTSVSLLFSHAFAKVRVVLTGDKKDDVTDVKIKTYTSCTLNTDGTLTAGSTKDFIPMVATNYNGATCWEANVVPGHKIEEVKVNEEVCTLTTSITPEISKWHEITIDTHQKPIDINSGSGDINITGDGKYLIQGNGTSVSGRTIVINGSPTVTLSNINMSNNNCIHIKGGSPIIVLDGTNKLGFPNYQQTRDPLFRLEGENTHVTIQGNGTLEIDATFDGSWEAPCIGPVSGKKCGNITILGGTVKVYASTTAGIGSSNNGSCGKITIKNATVDAKGSPAIGASSLGNGGNSSCGDILIENTNLTATVFNEYGNSTTNIGCGSSDSGGIISCGTITITHTGKTRAQILSTITGGKPLIGKGETNGTSSCGLITITGSDGTQTYSGDTGVTK